MRMADQSDHQQDPPVPSDVPNAQSGVTGNAEKDPSDWVTGDEPMTGPQASYLQTLAQEAGEEFDATLTKAQASERIDALQEKTGRGK
jgi:uncharacterized damage-inducible protein DinB